MFTCHWIWRWKQRKSFKSNRWCRMVVYLLPQNKINDFYFCNGLLCLSFESISLISNFRPRMGDFWWFTSQLMRSSSSYVYDNRFFSRKTIYDYYVAPHEMWRLKKKFEKWNVINYDYSLRCSRHSENKPTAAIRIDHLAPWTRAHHKHQ